MRGEREGMKGREMGMHEKEPQNAIRLAYKDAIWGLSSRVITFYRAAAH